MRLKYGNLCSNAHWQSDQQDTISVAAAEMHVVRFHLARHTSRTSNVAVVKCGLQSHAARVIGNVLTDLSTGSFIIDDQTRPCCAAARRGR